MCPVIWTCIMAPRGLGFIPPKHSTHAVKASLSKTVKPYLRKICSPALTLLTSFQVPAKFNSVSEPVLWNISGLTFTAALPSCSENCGQDLEVWLKALEEYSEWTLSYYKLASFDQLMVPN